MKVTGRMVSLAAAVAVAATPAVALAHGTPHGKSQTAPGHVKKTTSTSSMPAPGASPGAKAKAYGRYCQGMSKRHVAGKSGTPFSNCVTDMAKMAHSTKADAHRVCASNESRKHIAGENGTPYSQCVAAAAKLRRHSGASGSGSSGSGS